MYERANKNAKSYSRVDLFNKSIDFFVDYLIDYFVYFNVNDLLLSVNERQPKEI